MKKSKAKILILKNKPENWKELQRILTGLDYIVERGEKTKISLDKLDDKSYDLLILDFESHNGQDFELLKFIKSDRKLRDTPVIVVIDAQNEYDIKKCLEIGAEDFINKPFNPPLLNARIKASIDKKRLLDKERRFRMDLMHELLMARKIQRNLIPLNAPSILGLAFSCVYNPMFEIGGDFYDFVRLREENKIGIFISDVSGHGVPAALITSMVKVLLETAGANKISPFNLLNYLNTKLFPYADGNFLSAFYGLIDLKKNTLKYAKGGHPAPILIRDGEITELDGEGTILAVFEKISIIEKEIKVKHKDKILFFTDGLTDTENYDKDTYENQFLEILKKHHQDPIIELVNKINESLLKHLDQVPQPDDVCIVGVEFI